MPRSDIQLHCPEKLLLPKGTRRELKNREINMDSQKHLQKQESRGKKRKNWKRNGSEVIYEAAIQDWVKQCSSGSLMYLSPPRCGVTLFLFGDLQGLNPQSNPF